MQIRCKNGHYYDESLGKCPYCLEAGTIDIPYSDSANGKGNTKLADIPNENKSYSKNQKSNQKDINNNIKKEENIMPKDTKAEKTETSAQTVLVMPTKKKEQSDNMQKQEIDRKEDAASSLGAVNLAGWLVVISDNNKGRSYNITFGFNTLGRAESNHIVLGFDNSISREKHASIIYDYTNNRFFIKHEDGKYLTYLNDDVILETKELKPYDIITIGNTKLLFVPLCGENFKWDL